MARKILWRHNRTISRAKLCNLVTPDGLTFPAKMPENLGARNMTDTVLFRKLFTKTMARQVHAENRLHQLMMVQKGTDATFDEYLAKVRKKVEQDAKRVQKLGKLLAVLERKEETTVKGEAKVHFSRSKVELHR